MIHVRELGPDDAPAVARIEAALHDPSLADGKEAHRRYLAEAVKESVNLSFGVFDDDALTGYILCYGMEPASFPGETGEALYIEDLAILPKYRAALPLLLRRFVTELENYFPGVPLEAHSLERVMKVWKRHEKAFSRLGIIRSRHAPTGETVAGQQRYVIRWDVRAPQTSDAGALAEVLERLRETRIEVDGVPYAVKVIREERDWPALATVWEQLLLATPDHTVFQSYAYQRLWWKHFGGDERLFIVLILRDGQIQGIAPLKTSAVKYCGRYFRHLGFIGSRWEVDRPTFFFPKDRATLQRVLVRFLTQHADNWDFCELYEQSATSPDVLELQNEFRRAGYLVGTERDSDCPYLLLEGTWRDFLSKKSQKFRKNLKAAGRKLAEGGKLEYRVYDSLPDVRSQLENYRGIEARSWKSEEGVGVSRSEDYFDFYREMVEVFGQRRAFIIRMLTVNDQAIAGTFGLSYDGVYYSLQIAHARQYDRCSPGTYLESLEIEECFGKGYREYEFLGGFLNNKSRWTDTFRRTRQIFIFRRTPFFLLTYLLFSRIKPWVKELIRPYMKSWRQDPPQ